MARTEVATDAFADASQPRELQVYNASWVKTTPGSAAIATYGSGTIYEYYGAADSSNYYNSTFADDQYAELTLANAMDGAYRVGVTVRNSVGTDAARDHYLAYIIAADATNSVCHIAKVVDGAGRSTSLATSSSTAFGAGDKLSLHVVGNVLSAYKNWTGTGDVAIATYTDSSSPLTTGKAGIFLGGYAVYGGIGLVTAWSGGDLTSGASAVASIGRHYARMRA